MVKVISYPKQGQYGFIGEMPNEKDSKNVVKNDLSRQYLL